MTHSMGISLAGRGKVWAKSWARPEDIPKGKAVMVIEHPFHNRYVSFFRTLTFTLADALNGFKAFALTDNMIHYRTADRGRMWRSFEVPVPPALVARRLSFHSDPKKWGSILYQATLCNRQGWDAVCHNKVRVILTFSDS
jgi:hypothetical protein